MIGERYDGDAGLQYLNARYYDPKLAMFIQPDWWEVTKAGVGTNRYSYSFDNPVNGKDPTGHQLFDATGLAGLEATQDQEHRDQTYKENAKTHSDLAKKFRAEEGPDDVIKYHEDAAYYYTNRVGISTADLLAEAEVELFYAGMGARYGSSITSDLPAGSYASIE
jgi:RHS repeat-associated protein